MLSISEVVVVECVDGPTREVFVPLGALFPNEVLNYTTFTQSGLDEIETSLTLSESIIYI